MLVRRVAVLVLFVIAVVPCAFATTYYGAAGGGGDWQTNTTWRLGSNSGTTPGAGFYPGSAAGDIAIIDFQGIVITVTGNVPNAVTINFDNVSCNVAINAGGSLTLTGNSSLSVPLVISGGSLQNAGALNVGNGGLGGSGSLTMSAGSFSGVGTTNIATGSPTVPSLNLSGGTITDQVINVSGTVNQTGSWVYNGTGVLAVLSGANYNLQSGSVTGTGGTIINGGTLTKSGGTDSQINIKFNNNNLVQVTGATLVVGSTASQHTSGTFNLGTGTFLEMNGTFNGTCAVTGVGTAKVVGTPTVAAGGTLNMVTVFMAGGWLQGPGAANISGSLTWTGGVLQNGLTATLSTGATMNFSGSGTGFIDNASLTIASGATATINIGSGASLGLNNGGSIINNGALNLTGDVTITSNLFGTNVITNNNAMTKNGGTGTATIQSALNNSGSLSVTTGVLKLQNGGLHDGSFSLSGGGIQFGGGIHQFITTATIGGTGSVSLSAGTMDVDINMSLAASVNFQQSGGVLTGAGNLTINSMFLWTGGTHGNSSGAGLTFATAGVNASSPTSTLAIDGRQFNSSGTFTFGGSTFMLNIVNSALLVNNGIFDATGSAQVGAATGNISNAGTFRKTGGTAATVVGAPITNSGQISSQVSGQSLVISAGGTQTGGGSLNTAAGALIDFFGGTYIVPAGTSPFMGSGIFRVNGGTLQITGSTSVPAPAVLQVQSGALNVLTSITFTVFNSFQWTGGTLQGNGMTRVFGGSIGNTAPTTMMHDHTLAIAGPFTYNTTTLTIDGTATLLVEVPVTMTMANGSTIAGASADALTVNGTIDATAGTANINASGSMTGGTLSGGTFQFGGTGSFTINSGSVAGAISVAGATLTITPNVSLTSLALSAGTLTGAGNVSVSGGTWTGGTMSGAGSTNVTAGTFNINAGTAKVLVRPFGNSGTLNVNSGFDISFVTLTNNATMNLSSVTIGGASGVIQNAAGGTLTLNGGGATINAVVNNDGSVVSNIGTLNLSGGGTHTGDFTAGNSITFGGIHNFAGTSDLGGAGGYGFNGASTLGGTYTAGSSSFNAGSTTTFNTTSAAALGTAFIGGNVDGTAVLNVTGAGSNWTSGALSGPSAISIANTATFAITGAGSQSLARPLTNNGAVTLNTNLPGSGSIANFAAFTANPGGAITVGPAFSNQAAAATVLFQSGAVAFNGGYTQTAGATTLNTGSFSSPLTVNILGGSVAGTGTIGANVVNGGTFAPGLSAGILTVSGNYTQTASGIISAEIGGNTPGAGGYDRVAVTGNVTLDGTLNAVLINSYVPVDGDIYDLVTWGGTRTGTFATTNLPPYPFGTLTPTYEPNAYRITIDAVGDVAITKTGPATGALGSNVSYTITVTNNGPATADGVVVTDAPPANLTFVSNSGDCLTAFPCSLGSVPATTTRTITTTYTINGGAGSTLTNTASVSTTTTDAVPGNNSASHSLFVELADVAVSKTGPATAALGSNVSFTITVSNNGPSAANGVVVSDPTPANLAFVSNAGDCTTAFPCALGSIPASTAKTITATYTVTGGQGTNITNTASATSTTTDTPTTNNTASHTFFVELADVSITKTGPATGAIGSNVSFVITVTNSGPSPASGVVVTDPTPANLSFVSNSGDCSTAFPCALGSIPVNATKTITATYTVTGGSGSTITNSANVSSTTTDNATTNNAASHTFFVQPSDLAISKTGPAKVLPGQDVTFTILVVNGGTSPAANVVVTDPTPSGLTFLGNTGGCTTSFPCNLGTIGSNQSVTIQATYSISGALAGSTVTNSASVTTTTADDPSNNTSNATFVVDCLNSAPDDLSPTGNTTPSGTLSWRGRGDSYIVYFGPVGGGCSTQFATTTARSVSYSGLEEGKSYEWRVESLVAGCAKRSSACVTLTVPVVPPECRVPDAPLASVVGQATSAKTYAVEWDAVAGAVRYEIDEANNPDFNGSTRLTVTETSKAFKHDAPTEPLAFYYRVRAFTACTEAPGAFSPTIRVIIIPLPPPNTFRKNVNVPAGSEELIVQQFFVPGEPGKNLTFTATTDRPWLTVNPSAGVLPPQGVTLDVVADPKGLPNGTFTSSVIVVITDGTSNLRTNATTTNTVPISLNLVTPVSPVATKPGTSPYALIIPTAGHLDGIGSHWQSDVRVTNAGFKSTRYRLTFTPAAGTSAGVKQTDITVDAGATTALDDIISNWFGLGTLGDGANGMLEILPLDEPATTSLTTVASSRTYNVSGNGTLGQYIPAVPFPNFIGRALPGALPQVLSLQQIAQNAAYRTNVGLAEASGAPVTAMLTVLSSSGAKLKEIPVQLGAGEQRQMNQLLAQNGIELGDGRIEVKVTGGDGKITAYASVVDSATQDPLLVSGEPLSGSANRYVLAGVANLQNPVANWQTDMRVFNFGTSSQPATLTFFPFNNGASKSVSVLLGAGQIMTLDNILKSQFDSENTGGVVHLSTLQPASLVVTGRTYNQTANGTFGQFVPAVTVDEAVAANGRTLHILQVEDSSRYRTNVGVAEVTGKPATVEMQIVLPDSKITPTVQVSLAANEFRQFNPIRDLGVGNVYNARITVRVIGGDGRVTAYGSVIDEVTQDPTYVPAQ